MIGSPALILGICRYDEDDSFWQKFQLFTGEDFLESTDESLKKYALKQTKYHGQSIHFESINKDVKVMKCGHDFNLADAEPLDLTKEELKLVQKELNKDLWQDFDWETWGK